MNKRLTDENLTQIKERTGKATEGKWRHTLTTPEYDTYFIGSSNVDGTFTPIGNINGEADATFIAHAREDIPKLLAEIEYLRGRQAELLEYNRMYLADIKRMSAEVERLNMRLKQAEEILELDTDIIDKLEYYDNAIRNLDALADSVRYRLGSHENAEDVADEIVGIISELERKVGDIT